MTAAPNNRVDLSAPLPKWVKKAVVLPVESGTVKDGKTKLAYRLWRSRACCGLPATKTPIILLHGFLAHARWWDWIGPMLARGRDVAALDLSGFGDSDHREPPGVDAYDPLRVCKEPWVLANHLGWQSHVLVGHSFGGGIAIQNAKQFPETLAGLVVIDCGLPLKPRALNEHGPRATRCYDTQAEILQRFRLMPEQPMGDAALFTYVARHSAIETTQGWEWKFDDRRHRSTKAMASVWNNGLDDFAALKMPKAILRGTNSALCNDEWVLEARKRVAPANIIDVPNAHHHMMLDQPLAFLQALSSTIAGFDAP